MFGKNISYQFYEIKSINTGRKSLGHQQKIDVSEIGQPEKFGSIVIRTGPSE